MSNILIIQNAEQVVTVSGHSEKPAKKEAMNELNVIENGTVIVQDGKIADVGTHESMKEKHAAIWNEAEHIDASGKIVTPGLIDPHTHLVHAGTREDEYAMRLNGKTYMEIMNAGGGIHATTRATQAATHEELYDQSISRMDTMLLHGVTTVEAKSGYGLTVEDEMKQLEVAKSLQENHPLDIVSTFMGAHAVPLNQKDDPEKFVDYVINEMLPKVADENLAVFNDVFCERGVFTPEQTEKILEAGKEYGLIPKIHADEIEPYAGAELAAKVGAISADHLLKASDEGIREMAANDVMGVLLPGTAFFLMAEYAKVRNMIEQGVPVALSTDANPGSSPTLSLQFIMNLGCLNMEMTPAETVTATTINAAHAIGVAEKAGSIEKGKDADLTIFNVPNYLTLSYQYGMNHADTVVKKGVAVVKEGHLK